jgi:D-alanyl-D-alanine carboxypeptidase
LISPPRLAVLVSSLAVVVGCAAPPAPPAPTPTSAPTSLPSPSATPTVAPTLAATATASVAPTPLAATATPVPTPTEEPRPALRSLIAAPRRVAETPPPEVTAQYVAILDEDSGAFLYGSREHERVAPASITKIATTLVALEREPDLGRRVDVTVSGSQLAARTGSSIMGLEPGENVSLQTLLYGMMLPSGNDAAEQVALALAGGRETYVNWMNERVLRLGLRDTHFVNPSGLDASGHYSSAYDMALLGREAMRNPVFRQLAGTATFRGDGFRLANLNRLLGVYPGADGVKIGSTRRAGKTMVASATRDGHRVYVVVMHSSDLPGDTTLLFNWVRRSFAW